MKRFFYFYKKKSICKGIYNECEIGFRPIEISQGYGLSVLLPHFVVYPRCYEITFGFLILNFVAAFEINFIRDVSHE